MNVYETRRTKRLSFERRRRARRRRILKIWLGLIGGAVLLIGLFGLLAFLLAPHFLGSGDAEETAVKPTDRSQNASASYQISRDLAAQINAIDDELGLATGVLDTDDLPTGPAVAVAVRDLTDQGRGTVNFNGDQQITSASTYKLFVAYAMIRAVETGQMKWTSPLNGTTLENCLDRMIIDSDNICAEAYLTQLGLKQFQEQIEALGISPKTQFNSYDMRITANDLALFLTKLYRGELTTAEHRDKLLELMKQQRYREGIPSAISTAAVANKVGFMDGLLHDAAIVLSERDAYVLVILTNDKAWEFIADLAAWIDRQMRR